MQTARRRSGLPRRHRTDDTVRRDGIPVAFIDWDTIRPSPSILEFGTAVWKHVPLGNNNYFHASDFPTQPPTAARLALFARSYGIIKPHHRSRRGARSHAVHGSDLLYFDVLPAEIAAQDRLVEHELDWFSSIDEGVASQLDGGNECTSPI